MISHRKQEELKAQYDMVVYLYNVKKYSFSEIAQQFNKTKGWAHWAYKRANVIE